MSMGRDPLGSPTPQDDITEVDTPPNQDLASIEGEAMTRSLPPEPAVFGEGRANTYRPTTRDRVVGVLAGVGLHSMPHMPERVKRALLGGKSITIDGNTLD